MGSRSRTSPSHVAIGETYAHEVVEGRVAACRWVRLACERQINDLARWGGKDQPYYYDHDAAERVCQVVELFPHIKGDWAVDRQHLVLQPWQAFILTTVFGWKRTTTGKRRYRVAYTEVPRKNAKSTITSAVGNYLLACDGEAGAYVVLAANTRDQAKFVFTDSQIMARREPGLLKKFGVEVLAHAIVVGATASKFEALSAEHSNLDGLNIHAALIDELHAHPTRGLWDVLETATGSRNQSIIWSITTAGVNRASVCYDQRSHVIEILTGHVTDESYFGIIFTIDDGDDPWDESTWFKANPNLNVSKYLETIRPEAQRAQHMPSAQNNFLCRHLDIWVNADVTWLPAGSWERCVDPNLDIEDFAHQPCYVGLDLARRSDITAMMIVFPPTRDRDWWAVFGRYYLPEQTVSRAENSHYQGWELSGRLVSTPGIITDFDYIINDLDDIAARYHVEEIVFDPHDASPLYASLDKRGIRVPKVDVKQSPANMSPAMVAFEGLVLSRTIRHDGDPVLAWMMSNVQCRRGSGDLIQPKKESEAKKIDGVTATLMCLNRALRRDQPVVARVTMISMED